ncbi:MULTISPECIES: biopolymer transporter ExbD [unclassified Ruegeria]|jgi:biopolymer transport protein ExbD|uniref:ExbD/TolR family protein n=1 Tax=unclassified Ruegeria TaxID=2625375 RepID=UPI001AD99EBA|nr:MULTISPECIES: biopolymer transporter ExbD [unclassified Ruegeria]MBO9412073.1 biopolymer transporter ExbD [Ruegeria sp. R8_1]MBO9417182.1 biopolymer transporter ExbD [Ruegeria sp. R8_2]
MIRSIRPRRKRDSTIALINVVFLMLIFFLIAGTVAVPLDPELQLVDTSELDGREPPDALVMHSDGSLSFRGTEIEPEAYMQGREPGPVRIVPDREALGARLVEVTGTLRRLGATSVFVVTQKALE